MRIGIDLTWVKPKKSGGVESYIRNLLDGFLDLKDKNEYICTISDKGIGINLENPNDIFECNLTLAKNNMKMLHLTAKRRLFFQEPGHGAHTAFRT